MKIPPEAFDFYVSLGHTRTYQQVADKYGVSRRGVQKVADRDDWGGRLDEIEREAQERSDKALSETVAEIRVRHLKMLKGMAGRAVKAISEHPLNTGMEGMRAAEIVIKLERLIAGEPSERTEHTIAEVTRQEIDRFLSPAGEAGDEEDW
jgi:SOS-response transcriptional repressor LexA